MCLTNRLERGEEASSLSPNSHSKRLVVIRYRDHVLFLNSDPSLYDSLNVREVVGWIDVETKDFIRLTLDRSIKSLPHERLERGLVISKPDIVEIIEIRKPY